VVGALNENAALGSVVLTVQGCDGLRLHSHHLKMT